MGRKNNLGLSPQFSKKLLQVGAIIATVIIGNFLYNNAERYVAGHLSCENKIVYITIGAVLMFLLIMLLNWLEVRHAKAKR